MPPVASSRCLTVGSSSRVSNGLKRRGSASTQLTSAIEIPANVFWRIILKQLFLECSEGHVGQHDFLAERLERLLTLEQGPLGRHLDHDTQEACRLRDELQDKCVDERRKTLT